jgi:micrococcal nuclease
VDRKTKRVCPSCGTPIDNTGLTFCPECGVNMHKSGSTQGADSAGSSAATSTGCLSVLLLPFKFFIGIIKVLVDFSIRLGKWLDKQKVTLPIKGGIKTSLLVITLVIGGVTVVTAGIVGQVSGPAASPDKSSSMFAESTADVETAQASYLTTQTAKAHSTDTALAADTPEPTDTLSLPTSTNTPKPTSTPEPTDTPKPAATSRPQATSTPGPTDTPPPTATSTSQRTEAQVVEVVDGDTIKVDIAGEVFTVRYIGIDTPELDQPAGAQARDANAQLVSGQTIYLEKDVSETDGYDRLLRYAYLANGTFINAELVRQGYAQAKRYEPDVKRQESLEEIEHQAREAQRGLWEPTPVPPPTATPAPSGPSVVRIIAVNKRAEYVDIQNSGGQAQDLTGWTLVSERGDQRCRIEGIVLEAGATLRIWAMAEDQNQGGYNCKFGTNIWNNSESDPAVLYDGAGQLVDRYP